MISKEGNMMTEKLILSIYYIEQACTTNLFDVLSSYIHGVFHCHGVKYKTPIQETIMKKSD